MHALLVMTHARTDNGFIESSFDPVLLINLTELSRKLHLTQCDKDFFQPTQMIVGIKALVFNDVPH